MLKTWKLATLPGLLLFVAGALMLGLFTGPTTAQDEATATPIVDAATSTPTETLVPTTTPPPPIPAGALTGTVIRATVLFARSEPYLGADPVERVRRGETYQIVGRNPDATWFLIQLYGGQGWVWGYYIFVDGNAFDAPITNPFINEGDPANESALVVQSTAALKLRELPNVTAEQIGRVPWGEPLPVIGRTDLGQWYEVVYQDTVGWVYAPYTEIVEGSLNAVPITDPFLNGGIVIPAAAIPEFDISADNVQVIVVTNPPQLPTATSTPIFIIVTATPSPMP